MAKVYFTASNTTTPIGFSTHQNFEKIYGGTGAIEKKYFEFLDSEQFVSSFTDEQISELSETHFQKNAIHYSKLEKLMIYSISEALSKIDPIDYEKTAIVICSTKGNIDQIAQKTIYLSDLATQICGHFSFRTKPFIVSNACISGVEGIITAQRLIKNGYYKNAIVCGGDLMTKFVLSGFKSFNAVSDTLCRPFDEQRKGINLGEAAATVILSDKPTNGINIEVVDGTTSNDATHISAPSRTGQGLYEAIERLKIRTKTDTVDVISAHGTATIYNDEMEATAFSRAGFSDIDTHSLKGYFGHTLGAAGLLESALLIESMLQNKMVASKGFANKGTTQGLNICKESAPKNIKKALKTASGFGGGNAAVLFEKI